MGANGEEGSQAGGVPESEGPSTNPWNIMIKHRQVARRGRRSQMAVSFTNPNISMDLLRAVLQPHINEEIRVVINKYTKFFQKAACNVKENIGEDVDIEQLVQETCKNCLEQAKMMYSDGGKMITKPIGDTSATKRSRQMEDDLSQRGSPVPKKRKGRPPGHLMSFDRTAPNAAIAKVKYAEPIKREGPKWDPARLNSSTTFALGSRANKALGMGGTRGRIYIKHPELFKYSADSQDKHWLGEKHHMPATGGKMAYLLIEDDIRELAANDDYRDCPELRLDELRPFIVPMWMLEKMQKYMIAVRTEKE
ncbi:deoxynucleotidyltransferase terminal-interacting protein 1 [Leucoraja erinacea]|uniref:deoxynucleotidyltransferase terminal-interacting protein 1 n=1 Tax=Leucoraja erinaceus TaxID=7782 RepID=UPI00245404F4|nr:deoxynucleotidyltransferase terminal-interacting protein 1 [Leucoraja erinacea]